MLGGREYEVVLRGGERAARLRNAVLQKELDARLRGGAQEAATRAPAGPPPGSVPPSRFVFGQVADASAEVDAARFCGRSGVSARTVGMRVDPSGTGRCVPRAVYTEI